MEWWQILLIGVASTIVGIFLGFLPNYLTKRFGKKRETALVIDEQFKLPASGLLEEVETNLKIATSPWTGKLLPFQTRMWGALQDEVNKLRVELQGELLQTYIDIRLANSVVRLSTEFDHTTYDLNQSYIKLRTSIAERLIRIKLLIETNTYSSQLTKPSLALDKITTIELPSELRIIEPILYLLAIFAAQMVTAFYIFPWGFLSHTVILTVMIVRSALTQNSVHQCLLLSLALVPLLRIISLVSLVLPLGEIPPMLLYFLSYALVFIAAAVILGIFRYTWTQVGVRFRRPHTQLIVGLTGIVFGLLQYYILVPEPMIVELTWQEAWLPALVLLVSAGFMQEFVFRGLLQSSSIAALGGLGIVYVSLIFAIIHIGLLPATNIVFVFVIALFYGWVVRKTGSVLGVALSYGICNILLYLIIPFFF